MRLWHKDLIPLLPRNQLIGQWRECCALAKGIAKTGKTNHILINRIMEYPLGHFYTYCTLVRNELRRRGYACNGDALWKWVSGWPERIGIHSIVSIDELFKGWHNKRYLLQCYYNLEEKYDCGGISVSEFAPIAMLITGRDG